MLEIPTASMYIDTTDVIAVPQAEFGRLQRAIAVATERFKQATEEKQGLLALFGSLQSVTPEDRKEFVEQIETEHEAYGAIKRLNDQILHLVREKPQAKAATNHR